MCGGQWVTHSKPGVPAGALCLGLSNSKNVLLARVSTEMWPLKSFYCGKFPVKNGGPDRNQLFESLHLSFDLFNCTGTLREGLHFTPTTQTHIVLHIIRVVNCPQLYQCRAAAVKPSPFTPTQPATFTVDNESALGTPWARHTLFLLPSALPKAHMQHYHMNKSLALKGFMRLECLK